VAQEPTEEDAEYYQNVAGQDTEPDDFENGSAAEESPDLLRDEELSPLASPADGLQQD